MALNGHSYYLPSTPTLSTTNSNGLTGNDNNNNNSASSGFISSASPDSANASAYTFAQGQYHHATPGLDSASAPYPPFLATLTAAARAHRLFRNPTALSPPSHSLSLGRGTVRDWVAERYDAVCAVTAAPAPELALAETALTPDPWSNPYTAPGTASGADGFPAAAASADGSHSGGGSNPFCAAPVAVTHSFAGELAPEPSALAALGLDLADCLLSLSEITALTSALVFARAQVPIAVYDDAAAATLQVVAAHTVAAPSLAIPVDLPRAHTLMHTPTHATTNLSANGHRHGNGSAGAGNAQAGDSASSSSSSSSLSHLGGGLPLNQAAPGGAGQRFPAPLTAAHSHYSLHPRLTHRAALKRQAARMGLRGTYSVLTPIDLSEASKYHYYRSKRLGSSNNNNCNSNDSSVTSAVLGGAFSQHPYMHTAASPRRSGSLPPPLEFKYPSAEAAHLATQHAHLLAQSLARHHRRSPRVMAPHEAWAREARAHAILMDPAANSSATAVIEQAVLTAAMNRAVAAGPLQYAPSQSEQSPPQTSAYSPSQVPSLSQLQSQSQVPSPLQSGGVYFPGGHGATAVSKLHQQQQKQQDAEAALVEARAQWRNADANLRPDGTPMLVLGVPYYPHAPHDPFGKNAQTASHNNNSTVNTASTSGSKTATASASANGGDFVKTNLDIYNSRAKPDRREDEEYDVLTNADARTFALKYADNMIRERDPLLAPARYADPAAIKQQLANLNRFAAAASSAARNSASSSASAVTAATGGVGEVPLLSTGVSGAAQGHVKSFDRAAAAAVLSAVAAGIKREADFAASSGHKASDVLAMIGHSDIVENQTSGNSSNSAVKSENGDNVFAAVTSLPDSMSSSTATAAFAFSPQPTAFTAPLSSSLPPSSKALALGTVVMSDVGPALPQATIDTIITPALASLARNTTHAAAYAKPNVSDGQCLSDVFTSLRSEHEVNGDWRRDVSTFNPLTRSFGSIPSVLLQRPDLFNSNISLYDRKLAPILSLNRSLTLPSIGSYDPQSFFSEPPSAAAVTGLTPRADGYGRWLSAGAPVRQRAAAAAMPTELLSPAAVGVRGTWLGPKKAWGEEDDVAWWVDPSVWGGRMHAGHALAEPLHAAKKYNRKSNVISPVSATQANSTTPVSEATTTQESAAIGRASGKPVESGFVPTNALYSSRGHAHPNNNGSSSGTGNSDVDPLVGSAVLESVHNDNINLINKWFSGSNNSAGAFTHSDHSSQTASPHGTSTGEVISRAYNGETYSVPALSALPRGADLSGFDAFARSRGFNPTFPPAYYRHRHAPRQLASLHGRTAAAAATDPATAAANANATAPTANASTAVNETPLSAASPVAGRLPATWQQDLSDERAPRSLLRGLLSGRSEEIPRVLAFSVAASRFRRRMLALTVHHPKHSPMVVPGANAPAAAVARDPATGAPVHAHLSTARQAADLALARAREPAALAAALRTALDHKLASPQDVSVLRGAELADAVQSAQRLCRDASQRAALLVESSLGAGVRLTAECAESVATMRHHVAHTLSYPEALVTETLEMHHLQPGIELSPASAQMFRALQHFYATAAQFGALFFSVPRNNARMTKRLRVALTQIVALQDQLARCDTRVQAVSGNVARHEMWEATAAVPLGQSVVRLKSRITPNN